MDNLEYFTCSYCNKTSDTVLVVQKERHFYSLLLETNQWKDKGEEIDSRQDFCVHCNKKINTYVINTTQK